MDCSFVLGRDMGGEGRPAAARRRRNNQEVANGDEDGGINLG